MELFSKKIKTRLSSIESQPKKVFVVVVVVEKILKDLKFLYKLWVNGQLFINKKEQDLVFSVKL